MLYNSVAINISNLQSQLNNTAHLVTWNRKNSDLKLVSWLVTSPQNWWLEWTLCLRHCLFLVDFIIWPLAFLGKKVWITHGWTVVVRCHFTNLWLSIFKAWFRQSFTWSSMVQPWYDHDWPWVIMHHGWWQINVQKSHEIGQLLIKIWAVELLFAWAFWKSVFPTPGSICLIVSTG